MNISELLGEYERDYALSMVGVEDFPYERLTGKVIAVDGEAAFMKLAVCQSLLALNDDKHLSLRVIMLGEDNEASRSLTQRGDFFILPHEGLKECDFLISTGVCGLELFGTTAEYCKITHNISRTATAAAACRGRLILLSDYRVYGKTARGVVISENEAGFIPFADGGDMVQTTAAAVEAYFSAYAEQLSLKTIILRSGLLLGARAELPPCFTDKIFDAVAKGESISLPNTRNKYSFTYLNDMLYAVLYSFFVFRENSIFNIVSKNATVSVGMLSSMIYDIFPDLAKTELTSCEEEPHYGVAMNNAMVVNAGCEPQVDLSEAIQLCIKSRQSDEPFGYDDSHEGKMVDIQNVLIGYLFEVDRICRKHNIKYFLGGGTLLGAVRHGGFIPWDDDADIMMLRDDYDRFLEIAQSELPEGLTLQTSKTDKYCHYPFAKIRIDNTMFATKFSKTHENMNNGMAFDIFAHDNTANSSIGQKLHLQFTLLFRSMIFNKWNKRKINNKKPFQSFIANILKVIFPIRLTEWLQYRTFKLFKHKKNAKYLYDGMGRNVYHGAFPKYYLDEVIYINIHGHDFPIPKEYDKYLTYLYGDYRKLPPASKRQTSHSIVQLDMSEYSQFSVETLRRKM